MLMTNKKIGTRLRQVLINDKRFEPERLREILQNDLYNTLTNYLDITPQDIFSRIDIENGEYVLRCKVKAKRVKVMGIIPEGEI